MAHMQLLSICYQKTSWSSANPHKYWVLKAFQIIQTLGQRDLSGCFVVHICAFYSSYLSYFAFLCTSSKIFRAKMEPKHCIYWKILSYKNSNYKFNCTYFIPIIFTILFFTKSSFFILKADIKKITKSSSLNFTLATSRK